MNQVLRRWIKITITLLIIIMNISVVSAEDKKVVRVSCGINNALYLDNVGKPQGYYADFLNQLAVYNHWKLEYVEGSWNDSVQNLYDGKIDLLLPTNYTEDREETMLFSEYACGYQKVGLYTLSDADIFYEDFDNFNGKRIAISKGTSNAEELEAYAKKHNFTYIPVEYNSTQDKINALHSGKVDMINFSTFNNVNNAKIVSVIDSLPCYITTRKNDHELMDELNDGTSRILVENASLASTLFNTILSGNTVISYTRKEHDIIQFAQTIKVGLSKDTLPLSGCNSNGEPSGIYVDLLHKIEDLSGLKFDIVMYERKDLIYDKLRAGDIDFVVGSSSLPYASGNTSDIKVSDSIMDYTTVAISLPSFAFDDEQPIKFVLTKARQYLASNVKEHYPNATIEYVDTAKQCLIEIQEEKADVTLINAWEYNYHTKNARFEYMTEWENMRIVSGLVLGTTSEENMDIISVVEKSIAQLTDDQKDEIITSNLNMPYASYDNEDTLYTIQKYSILFFSVIGVLVLLFVVYSFMKNKSERELKNKNTELENANNAKTDFLSRMSHELRTPLNAMNGYNNIIRDNIESNQIDQQTILENLDHLSRASQYLLAIISDILNVQNIELGKVQLNYEEIDAISYMNNIVEIIKQEASLKNIEIEYIRETNICDTYMADGIRLQQILLNILHNAIKFSNDNSRVSMRVRAKLIDDEQVKIEFEIEDQGIGMDEEFIKNGLFQKFAQENHDLTSPYDGCGTGLYTTKQLIELMGGSIECHSVKGEGTTFIFNILARLVKGKKEKPVRVREKFDLKGIKVLLIEDNEMNQEIERRTLVKMNCVVDIAENGQIGLDRFKASEMNEYDVILMDIRMPVMDGLEATRRIRALNRDDSQTIPIIAVSANAFEEDIQKSLDAGMNKHIAKPIGGKSFYEVLKKFTQKD